MSFHSRAAFPVISIHALREEGDSIRPHWQRVDRISIHALREEGDFNEIHKTKMTYISIHALREEGDRLGTAALRSPSPFLSTPSARRATRRPPGRREARGFLSTPSARRATNLGNGINHELCIFLSTPSARRATAKTETKSLFSNKLYNILHEFRRALIYNGSKNYPNHAK